MGASVSGTVRWLPCLHATDAGLGLIGVIPVVHQLALFSHVWHIRAAAQLIALMGATYIVSELPSLVPPWLSMHHIEQCEEVTFPPHM
jgi:hypothetical protein